MAMAAANDITDKAPADWIWRTPQKDALAVQRALDYIAKNLKVKKIAVLHDENAFGSSGDAEIAKQAPALGLEVVASESYKTADTDMTAQLTKIKGANPEVLVVWGTNPGPALAAKNMKQLGITIPYVGSHGIANKTFIDLAGDAAEGVVFPGGRLLVPSSITDAKQKEVTEAFIADYNAKYSAQPNPFAGYALRGHRPAGRCHHPGGQHRRHRDPERAQLHDGLCRSRRDLQLHRHRPRRSHRGRHDHGQDPGRHLGHRRVGTDTAR